MYSRAFPASTSLLLLSTALLSGCGIGAPSGGFGPSTITMQGNIMGGQQPVNHATVQLYAVSNSDYGAASTTALTHSVTSGPDGGFSLTGLLNCPNGASLVYLVATGGNPGFDETDGTINNNALGLMVALGRCDSLLPTTHINLNELTTVAAAWALAPFMKGYDHVGTSPGNSSGLINAFAMANTLVDYSSGRSPGTAPTGATVPSEELNTLANILASCINTPGWTSGDLSACDKLFGLATPAGGTEPQNTIDAAVDIALHPGHNANAIAMLPTPQAPFQPGSTVPNDWTVAINFPVGSRAGTSGMAFDASGNLFVVAPDALYVLSPTGALQGSFPSMAGNSVAIDPDGNIWATTGNNVLSKMPSTLSSPTVYTAANGSSGLADGLAIDGSGNPWYTCDSCSEIYKFNTSDSSVNIYSGTVSGILTNLSIDTNENVWLGNFGTAAINVFKSDGTALPNSPLPCGSCGHPAFVANDGSGNAWIVGNDLTHLITSSGAFTSFDTTAGGLRSPASVAIDGAGNAWVANLANVAGVVTNGSGGISEFTNGDVVVSPSTGYISDTVVTPQSIAVDGSGNVWVRNTGTPSVTAFVGAGVPVVTPLALGVKNNSLGSQPK